MEIENGKYYELGRRTFWLLVFQRSIASLGLLLLALLIGSAHNIVTFQPMPTLDQILNLVVLGAVGLAIVSEVIGVVISQLEYNISRVMLDDVSFRIVRGIISKDEVVIPYRRIQSVEIDQNLVQRILKVGHVVIASTTNLEQPSSVKDEMDDEVVPVMDYDLAGAVAKALTSRAEVERMQVQPNEMNSAK